MADEAASEVAGVYDAACGGAGGEGLSGGENIAWKQSPWLDKKGVVPSPGGQRPKKTPPGGGVEGDLKKNALSA